MLVVGVRSSDDGSRIAIAIALSVPGVDVTVDSVGDVACELWAQGLSVIKYLLKRVD